MNRRAESGDSKAGCIVWLIVIAVAGLIAFRVVPVKIASAELNDFIGQQAQFAGRMPVPWLRQQVLDKAIDLDLPLEEKNIEIQKLPADQVRIKVTYTVILRFPFYRHHWTLTHDVSKSTYDV